MNLNWQEFLGTSGARIDEKGLVVDFGNAEDELAAAHDTTVIAPLTHLGMIECTGEEAKTFLHNQLSSDINHLGVDAAQHSAWCSAKGRMLASFLVFHNGADYQLQLSADLVMAILKRLQMFVLRSKVKLNDLSACREFIGLSGPQAEILLRQASLPVPALSLETSAFADGKVIRIDATRFEIIVSSEAAVALWRKLAEGARPVGTVVWQWLDIQAGIPLISEATREEFVPQMVNFDLLGGVSFHKGCYPGQEVIARTQYLGKVKRHLYHVRATTPIAAGNALYAPENPEHPCGMVTNAAPAPGGGYAALAVVQEGCVVTGDVALGVPDGPRIEIEREVTF